MNLESFDANFDDLNIGDKIVIIHDEDSDLAKWYDNQDDKVLTITELEPQSELLWVKDCPYAINMACVLKV